jgi:hypothetical protein
MIGLLYEVMPAAMLSMPEYSLGAIEDRALSISNPRAILARLISPCEGSDSSSCC